MNLRPFVVVVALAVLAMLVLSAWAWGQVPADGQVPVHWNLAGQVDGYAPKAFGLLFVPALSIGLAALLALLPRFEPRAANLARSGRAYLQVGAAIVWVLTTVHLAVVLAALGRPIETRLVVALAIGVLFVVLGNVLGKVRSNFIFGVRTPWTLASDRSWNRTHRLVGRLFVLLGLAILATGAFGGAGLAFSLLVGGLVVVLVVAFVYSYRVWRDDPDKQPIGRQPAA